MGSTNGSRSVQGASGATAVLPTTSEVVVVGGGLAGISVGYHLARAGREVSVLESGQIGGGASAIAAGVLSPPVRQPFHEIVRDYGEPAARGLWHFSLRSIAGLAELLRDRGEAEAAELDLRGGHVLAEPYTLHQVRSSYDALARAGLPVTWLEAAAAREKTGGRGFSGGYRLEGGGSLDPRGTVAAVGRAATDAGALLVEGAEVRSVGRRGSGLACVLDQGEVACGHVVYAAHVDGRRFLGPLGDALIPVRGQVFSTEPVDFPVEGGFATHWKMNVWRKTAEGGLVVSGWRHEAWDGAYGQEEGAVDPKLQSSLEAWIRTVLPALEGVAVRRAWSGVFGWTADFLPLVGAVPGRPGEWVVAAFGGGGLPFAFESGRAVAQLVTEGTEVPGSELFRPARFTKRRAPSPG